MSSAIFLLSNLIQKEPGIIVGPIARVLGFILNFIFELITKISLSNSLGLSIILLTIVARLLMLPLGFKQQKSMTAMQKLQPEVEKIRNKYTSKDPEVQQKMNTEIQALYAKHKVNPFSGCLPLIIQMPIFFALSYLMQQSYLFISSLGKLYHDISAAIIATPGFADVVLPLAVPKVPKGMTLDISLVGDMSKVINKLTQVEWSTVLSGLNSPMVQSLFERKQEIEFLFGINVVDKAGLAFPGILIPILAALTTFLSSYLKNLQNKPSYEKAKMQQQIMLIAMPLMMGWFTVSLPAGVGLYWATSSVFQVFQQLIINKHTANDKTSIGEVKKNGKKS